MEQLLSDVELECLVTNIPESIRVKVNDLQIDQTLLTGEIELPEGTKLVTDPGTPLATVRMKIEEVEEVAEVSEEEEAEPEVITREKEEGEEAEEK